jgi:hypothetical protein
LTQHYENHANKVVADFRKLLQESSNSSLTDDECDQLAMLIESAISTSVLQELESIAERVNEFAAEIRHHAERYD